MLKKLFILAAIALASNAAHALDVTWTQPTTRADGTPLDPTEIANYRVSWTLRNVAQPDVVAPPGTSAVLNPATEGRVCVTVYTIDTDGLVSDPSNTACKNAKPGKPLTVTVR